MGRARRLCDAVHVSALGLWLGALGLSAATAAIVFPTLRDLKPQLADFGAYAGPHWLLAGGQVANRVFLAGDIVQFGCVLTAGVTFGIAVMWLDLSMRRVSTFVRAALLLALVGVLAYRFGVVQPKWDEDVRRHWDAAKAGDNETAATYRAALDAAHPIQRRLMGATAGMVAAALAMALFASLGTDTRVREEAGG